jgi:hypothetical protein
MYETAKEFEALGLVPVPADVSKSDCSVSVEWVNNQKDADGWRHEFNRRSGIGIKLGSASGGLMVLDIDQKHDSTLSISSRFIHAIKLMFHERWDEFYIEETRSGGLHLFFRMEDGADRKTVPAKTLDFNKDNQLKPFALIEVLGEGNMVFTHPTNGYTVLQGSCEEIPVFSRDEFEEIIGICKTFNELPQSEVEKKEVVYPENTDPNDQRVGSIFNRNCDPAKFASYLTSKGWALHHKTGEAYFFTRPGKETGVSASWNHDGRKLFCVFSTSTDFETESSFIDDQGYAQTRQKGYTPFAVYTQLSHDGDFKAATKELVESGKVNPDEWDNVEPLALAKADPLKLDDLLPDGCEDFKRWVQEVARSYQVQPEMVTMPCLSIMSLALCGSVRFRVKDDWKEDAPLWSIVVADASERKSPVLEEVYAPLESYFEDFAKRNARELKSINRRKAVLQKKLEKFERDYENAMMKGQSTEKIEATIAETEDDIEEMPCTSGVPKLIQSDITPEALVQQTKSNGEVCGIISAEADPIEVALGLYSDKPNFTIYLKGYSVERYVSNRVGNGETDIARPRIVMSVMMQKEPMEKLAENRVAKSRGFLARCFFVVPESKVGRRDPNPPAISEHAREWWESRLHNILRLPHRQRFHNEDGVLKYSKDDVDEVTMTGEAYEVFMKARIENESDLGPGGEFCGDSGWGGKLMGNICRLALSLHFIAGKTKEEQIDAKTMEAAIRWVKPMTEHYFCAIGAIGSSEIDKRVHATILKMKRKGIESGASVNSIYKALKNRTHKTANDWQVVWDRMIELGFIRIVDGKKPTKGPAPKNMLLHPKFYELAQI